MPKKYRQKSLLTKPSSSARSNLSLSNTSNPQDGHITKTVNDLIQESRRGTGSERLQAIHTTSSIPPSLRAVLDIPAPPPPAPRVGVRGPTRLRRIPGPPPPRSWLADSIHASPEVKRVQWSKAHERTRVQQQSSILPEGTFRGDRSLQHNVLKRIAIHWPWHVEYDHEYLAELPVKIKETLLSYIAIYSEGQGPNPLHFLFPSDLDQEELNAVRRVDFGNAIGGWITLKKIERELIQGQRVQLNEPTVQAGGIPDSWDADGYEEPSIPAIIFDNMPRFHNLKHLSLALAPGTAGTVVSWADLLTFATKLSTISSLSLAYWPQPTYTPNASTSMAKISTTESGTFPQAIYGGTNFYSAFDNDWREAAGILRTLSRLLYCLKWLDLTGCGDWFPALTWGQLKDDGKLDNERIGPDWNGSWRELDCLILAVGWTPAPLGLEQSKPVVEIEQPSHKAFNFEHDDSRSRMSNLLSQVQSIRLGQQDSLVNTQLQSWNVENEREKYYHKLEVEQLVKYRNCAKEVARELRSIRKEGGRRWIDVDFGPLEEL